MKSYKLIATEFTTKEVVKESTKRNTKRGIKATLIFRWNYIHFKTTMGNYPVLGTIMLTLHSDFTITSKLYTL